MSENDKINDGKPWSAMDERTLKGSLANGHSIEDAALHLRRSGSIDEVRHKADELGLQYNSKPLPGPVPTHAIIKVDVVE